MKISQFLYDKLLSKDVLRMYKQEGDAGLMVSLIMDHL